MTERQYAIGVIGCGGMGTGHVRAIAADPRWELRWACDINDARRAEIEALAPGVRWTNRAEDLFGDETLDAVSIDTLSDVRPGSRLRRAAVA